MSSSSSSSSSAAAAAAAAAVPVPAAAAADGGGRGRGRGRAFAAAGGYVHQAPHYAAAAAAVHDSAAAAAAAPAAPAAGGGRGRDRVDKDTEYEFVGARPYDVRAVTLSSAALVVGTKKLNCLRLFNRQVEKACSDLMGANPKLSSRPIKAEMHSSKVRTDYTFNTGFRESLKDLFREGLVTKGLGIVIDSIQKIVEGPTIISEMEQKKTLVEHLILTIYLLIREDWRMIGSDSEKKSIDEVKLSLDKLRKLIDLLYTDEIDVARESMKIIEVQIQQKYNECAIKKLQTKCIEIYNCFFNPFHGTPGKMEKFVSVKVEYKTRESECKEKDLTFNKFALERFASHLSLLVGPIVFVDSDESSELGRFISAGFVTTLGQYEADKAFVFDGSEFRGLTDSFWAEYVKTYKSKGFNDAQIREAKDVIFKKYKRAFIRKNKLERFDNIEALALMSKICDEPFETAIKFCLSIASQIKDAEEIKDDTIKTSLFNYISDQIVEKVNKGEKTILQLLSNKDRHAIYAFITANEGDRFTMKIINGGPGKRIYHSARRLEEDGELKHYILHPVMVTFNEESLKAYLTRAFQFRNLEDLYQGQLQLDTSSSFIMQLHGNCTVHNLKHALKLAFDMSLPDFGIFEGRLFERFAELIYSSPDQSPAASTTSAAASAAAAAAPPTSTAPAFIHYDNHLLESPVGSQVLFYAHKVYGAKAADMLLEQCKDRQFTDGLLADIVHMGIERTARNFARRAGISPRPVHHLLDPTPAVMPAAIVAVSLADGGPAESSGGTFVKRLQGPADAIAHGGKAL